MPDDTGHGAVYQKQPLLNANDHIPQINFTHFLKVTRKEEQLCQ